MRALQGGVPEWPKGTGCKPVGSAYGGSNPPAPIHHSFIRSSREPLQVEKRDRRGPIGRVGIGRGGSVEMFSRVKRESLSDQIRAAARAGRVRVSVDVLWR
jgi:hypothetical protein